MEEKKVYRSALRSRRFICEAFMELLKEKHPEKITVTDIVKRADINRSTFYAHYTDVRNLMEELQREFVEQSMDLLKDVDFMELLQNPKPLLQKWVDIGFRNRELYTFLGKAAIAGNAIEQFKILLVEKALNLPEIPEDIRRQKNFEIRVNFFVGGIINVYQQFLVGNLDATPEEIITDIAAVITSSAHTILDVSSDRETE